MKQRILGLFGAVMCVMSVACAGPLTMVGSKSAPGARGTVKVTKSDNNNSVVDLKVEHLAPPDQTTTGAHAYVVWVQNVDHVSPQQNVGELRVDEDLKGTLSTITSLPIFDLTVTAEPSGQVATPSGQPILSVRVERAE